MRKLKLSIKPTVFCCYSLYSKVHVLKVNILFMWFDYKSWSMLHVVHNIVIGNNILKIVIKKTVFTEISGFWPFLSNDSHIDEKWTFLTNT